MKYLLVGDNGQEEQMLLDHLAAFFWNNGHEVYSRTSLGNEINYQNMLTCCDYIVLLTFRDYPTASFFERGQAVYEHVGLTKKLHKKIMLVFSKNGVYTNAIPFPHKIFHFEHLNKKELSRFFRWGTKLNLFIKHSPHRGYRNFIFL
ncbi:hypothetical protein [Olivibacter jilunii]|uniref:hypothetical protein n=1 Tax=Olivibacter jilunii TaxID=985016 RepID=UPI003F1904D9